MVTCMVIFHRDLLKETSEVSTWLKPRRTIRTPVWLNNRYEVTGVDRNVSEIDEEPDVHALQDQCRLFSSSSSLV